MPHRTGGSSRLGRRLAGAAGLLAAAIAGQQVARRLRDRGTPATAGAVRPDLEFRGSATGAADRFPSLQGARAAIPHTTPPVAADARTAPKTPTPPVAADARTAPETPTPPVAADARTAPETPTPPVAADARTAPEHDPAPTPAASARQAAGSGVRPGPAPEQPGAAAVSRAGRRAASVMFACGLALAAVGVNAVSGSRGSVVAGSGPGSVAGAAPTETAAPLAALDRRGPAPPSPSASPSRPGRPSGAATPVPSGASEDTSAAGAEPVRRNLADPLAVRIPAVGVDAPLGPLGLAVDGTLNAPTDYDRAGWYVGGPEPGEIGPALIAGHVDSFQGPAAFFRLRDIRPGDVIEIPLADGQTAVFAATATEQHPKTAFPTERVYGATPAPELRLVTCGGGFNATARSYEDNVIVFASFVELRPAGAP